MCLKEDRIYAARILANEGHSQKDIAAKLSVCAWMVDVSAKPEVLRTATAAGRISLAAHTVELIRENAVSKCEVLTGAKRTGELFPLPI